MKLNSFTLAFLVVVLIFGGIGVSTAFNWWETESTKVPVTYADGEFAGQYNPADIRGSYTFGNISELFEIPLSDLQAAFRLPDDVNPATYGVKDLENVTTDLTVEVGTASVRMFVAFYKGLPYDLSASEETYLFPEAAPILEAQNKILPEQVAYLESHLVPAENVQVEVTPLPEEISVTPVPTEHVQPEKTITGKTTFQELLDWGVSQDTIENILGENMPASSTVIKDYVTQKGLEFSALKTTLQTEVDKTK